MKSNSKVYLITTLILFVVLSISIGYSAFGTQLNIDDMTLVYRIEKDIRITDFKLSETSVGVQSKAAEYNYDSIADVIVLPSADSTITYKVQVTNIGTEPMGIFNITGLPSNLTYELKEYNLKDKICNGEQCSQGVVKEFYITIKYADKAFVSEKIEYNILLNFDFREFHKVTYVDFDNGYSNYPKDVIDGGTFRMTLQQPYPVGAKPFMEGASITYKYEGDTLVVENVTADLEIRSNYIQYIEDLVALSNNVNNGNSYSGKTIYLEKDLDFKNRISYRNADRTDFNDFNNDNITGKILYAELTEESGAGFMPVGNRQNNFQGVFDGNNKKIDNLYVHNVTTSGEYFGLFGRISNSIIKSLEVSGNVLIENINDIGGIVGSSINSSLINLVNRVNVTKNSNDWSTGGIVGSVYGEINIKECVNYGTIKNGGWLGGIVGGDGNGKLSIDSSINHGSILKEGGTVAVGMGGIVGSASTPDVNDGITIKNSYNDGKVIDTMTSERITYMGGIIGSVNGKTSVSVLLENTYNKADVTLVHDQFQTGKHSSLGGLIGFATYCNFTIKNSYNEGNISNGEDNAGLIAYASTSNIEIEKSHNSGMIKADNINPVDSRLGGLLGYTPVSNVNILDSYNDNLISSKSGKGRYYVSGILGVHDYGKNVNIINTYNIGDIESGGNSNGITHIYGNPNEEKYTNLYIDNCYNLGSITGNSSYAIGFIHQNGQNITNIKNAYYSNTLKSSNLANIGTSMSEANMKIDSFVSTLNSNAKSINLDSIVKNYKLSSWILRDNYAILPFNNIEDLSGNNHTATNYGVKTTDEGVTTRTNTGLGYINTNIINIDFSKGLTFITKIKVNDFSNGMAIMGNWETKGGGLYYANSKIFCIDLYELTPRAVCSNKTYLENTWYTLVGTYDNSKLKLYVINNENIDNYEISPSGTTISPVQTPITIGMDPDLSGADLNGYNYGHNHGKIIVKEALIFNRSLSEQEIKNNYVTTIDPINKSNLVAWYKF